MNIADTIYLSAPAQQKKQNFFSRALDIISAPLSQPSTTFSKGLSAGADKVRESRARISRGDNKEALKVIGTTLLSTGVAAAGVLGAGTMAGRSAVVQGAKVVGRAAAKKPLLALAGVGLATTKGGRMLIKEIPKKAFQGGQILGKVVGGEDPGLTVGGALKTAGLLGAAAIVGKKGYDLYQGKKETVFAANPMLPDLKQLGAADPQPVGIGGIPISQTPGNIQGDVSVDPSASTPPKQAMGPRTIVQISI